MSRTRSQRREKSATRRRARKQRKLNADQTLMDERGATPEGRRPAGTRPQADPAPPLGGAGGESAERQDGSGRAPLDLQEAVVSTGHNWSPFTSTTPTLCPQRTPGRHDVITLASTS